MKIGLVVEGGGMKCAYSAGILDKFLDDHIQFDYCIGVSAGAANTLSYLAGQRGRNLRFYTEHLSDPRYLSVHSLIRTGSLFGLQYIYGTLTNSDGKDPIDYDAIMKNPAEFYMPATDAVTGTATYFSKYDIVRDDYRTLMATCALPGFCRPVQVNHHYYYDGGVADSIPVQHALDDGCDKLVVILSNPRDFVKQPEAHRPIYKRMLHKYPKTIEGIDHRHINYQASIDLTAKLEKEGKAFVFAPKMRRLNKNFMTWVFSITKHSLESFSRFCRSNIASKLSFFSFTSQLKTCKIRLPHKMSCVTAAFLFYIIILLLP